MLRSPPQAGAYLCGFQAAVACPPLKAESMAPQAWNPQWYSQLRLALGDGMMAKKCVTETMRLVGASQCSGGIHASQARAGQT
jgi:hypothetical protein